MKRIAFLAMAVAIGLTMAACQKNAKPHNFDLGYPDDPQATQPTQTQ